MGTRVLQLMCRWNKMRMTKGLATARGEALLTFPQMDKFSRALGLLKGVLVFVHSCYGKNKMK